MPKRIEFDPPEDFVWPEGMGEDDEAEYVAVIRRKPDGRLCLVALDGIRMPGFRKNEDDGKTYAEAAAEGLEGEENGGY